MPPTNAEPDRRQIAKRERGWGYFSGLMIVGGTALTLGLMSAVPVLRRLHMPDLEINDSPLDWKGMLGMSIGVAVVMCIVDLIYSWECWLDRTKRQLEIEYRVGRWRWRRFKTFDELRAVVVHKLWIRDDTIHVDKGFFNRREMTWLVRLGESRGLEVGRFQLKSEAENIARELAEWSGLELRLDQKD